MVQNRQVAYKVWISNLINGVYHKEAGEWEPNYILVDGKKISRINLIATVVNKFSDDSIEYSNLELDDGSGTIMVKAWKEDVKLFDKVSIGSLILIVGRAKEFNEEKYILPEVVKILDSVEWAKLRRLELIKEYGEPKMLEKPVLVGESSESLVENVEKIDNASQNSRQKILDLIGKDNEIIYDVLREKSDLSEEEVENIIKDLIKEGEIYTPRPGYIRLI